MALAELVCMAGGVPDTLKEAAIRPSSSLALI
jgi:hypothetical protein